MAATHEDTVFLRPARCFEAEVAATHENTVFLRPSGCHARKHGVFEARIAESPPSTPDCYANLIFNIYIYIYMYIYIYIRISIHIFWYVSRGFGCAFRALGLSQEPWSFALPGPHKTPCFRAWQPLGLKNTVFSCMAATSASKHRAGLKNTVISCVASTRPQKHRVFLRGSHFQRNHSRKTSLLHCTL